MPLLTVDPVLHIEESGIRAIDTQKPSDLFGLWSAFSKCSGLLEHGQRLEYLSWRLLNRQTLCYNTKVNARTTPTQKSPSSASRSHKADEVPELSRSIDSVSSNNSTDSTSTPSREDCDLVSGQNVACETRKSTNPTAVDLENLVISIKNTQDLNSSLCSLERIESAVEPNIQERPPTPKPSSPRPMNTESSTSTVATADSLTSPLASAGSSATSGISAHSIVRGFDPAQGISSYTSRSQLAPAPTPILKSSASKSDAQKKKSTMFIFGASSGEDENSFRDRMSPRSRTDRPSNESQQSSYKKQTSFDEQVTEIRTFQLPNDESDEAIETDDEDDDSSMLDSENAIEEDDDEDAWEDDENEDVKDEPKQLQFPRVDSTANLTSRRSMLTLMREAEKSGSMQNSRSSPALRRSRTSTPNGPSVPASPTEESTMEMRFSGQSQTKPIIMTSSNTHPAAPQALSPRTTRRNMLAGELSESLRKQLLWERQQRNVNSSMGMRRAHTSTDVRNLQQHQQQKQDAASQSLYPAPPFKDHIKTASWNQYFDSGPGEYHQKGW